MLREHFVPEAIAESYAGHGAACLSVLTDVNFFQATPTTSSAPAPPVNCRRCARIFMVDLYRSTKRAPGRTASC